MANFSFTSHLGDNRVVDITATYPAAIPSEGIAKGDPYPLEEASEIWFTAKTKATDLVPVFTKKLSEGQITAEGSVATFQHSRADIPALVEANTTTVLVCEVQVRSASGNIWTVANGKWKFVQQIEVGE